MTLEEYQDICFKARDILFCGSIEHVVSSLERLDARYNDALAKIATLEKALEANHDSNHDCYVQCRCHTCGWEDGFLNELIDADGEVDGHCDRCKKKRSFFKLREH